MDLGLKGLRVIVTAGAGGIGLVTTRTFLAEGAKVHVCDVDEAAIDRLGETAPGATGAFCDVSDRAGVVRFMSDAVVRLGGLDCLVNNAGIAGPTGRVDEIDPEDWDRCLAICLTGQFNVARLAIPHLKQSPNASITNLSSAAGKFGFALRSPYAAAKWGVVGFTKTLAIELGASGIRCNAVLPGPVDGERIRQVIDAKARAANISFDDMKMKMLANQSIKELIDPQGIADQIVFLASKRARTISGQTLSVDGDMQCTA
jgi:NAD(P)-dependent dehydrogenase (short-subunit alcohol dehydrogenase family)